MPAPTITPVLFVGLDWTIRYTSKNEGGFVHEPQDIEIYDGVVDILRSYKRDGWRIVAISNQGGIAMGYVSENTVNRGMLETNRMCANFFDRMHWCTHYPNAVGDEVATKEEKSICFCRKPKIGLVVMALVSMAEQYGELYRPYACLFVGDREEDRLCAEAASIPFVCAREWRNRGPR